MLESSETLRSSMKRRINVRDASYLAAMFDAEGYISGSQRSARNKRQGRDAQLCARICNTSQKLLDWLHKEFEGRERWREPRVWGKKRFYEWEPWPEHRLIIYKAMLPHMKIKRGQLLLAIGFLNSQKDKLPVEHRQKIIRAIQALNR